MILVDVYVPSLDEVYDFRLDDTAKVISIIHEVSDMLSVKYKCSFNKKRDEFMLCSMDDGRILYHETTLWENNIKNGSRLMLV